MVDRESVGVVERFWARFVVATSGVHAPRADAYRSAAAWPARFTELLTHGSVQRIAAPDFAVGAVGDWLAHAWDRHCVMQAIAEASANPGLASMIPFGDTPSGLEVALNAITGRVVWLDPTRFDCGTEAVAAVLADSIDEWLERACAEGETSSG